MRLWVRFLPLLSGLTIQHCSELWCRPVATAPIRPLAWEPPYAEGVAQEMAKRLKKKKRKPQEDLKEELSCCAVSKMTGGVASPRSGLFASPSAVFLPFRKRNSGNSIRQDVQTSGSEAQENTCHVLLLAEQEGRTQGPSSSLKTRWYSFWKDAVKACASWSQ